MEENKNTLKKKIISVIFLIWFFGSIIAMLILSKINGYYTIMIFGQYFVVFGLAALKSIGEKGIEKLMALAFVLVGLSCIIIPFLMMNQHLLQVKLVWNSVILLLMMLAFVIAGLFMTFYPIYKRKKDESECTMMVTATITRCDCIRDKNKNYYCPVYEFEFDKIKYTVSNDTFTNFGLKPVGTMVNLMINPQNPKQFMDNGVTNKFIMYMGILFLLFSVPILIYILKTFTFVM